MRRIEDQAQVDRAGVVPGFSLPHYDDRDGNWANNWECPRLRIRHGVRGGLSNDDLTLSGSSVILSVELFS